MKLLLLSSLGVAALVALATWGNTGDWRFAVGDGVKCGLLFFVCAAAMSAAGYLLLTA